MDNGGMLKALAVVVCWLVVMAVHRMQMRPERIRATVESQRAFRLALRGEHIDEAAVARRVRKVLRFGQVGATAAMVGAVCVSLVAFD